MELKPGYKQTEAGVIPEEWDCSTLGDFVQLQRGYDLTWRDRRNGDVPVMGSAGRNGFHNAAIAKGPGVVLGRSGASFGQAHYCEEDFWPHNTALYVTDFRENRLLFVFYFLSHIDFSRYNSGGARQSLNRNFISPIVVGLPRPPEQRAIAEVLSDVDGLLNGLDRLIAKKRDLKQAAMQQLLTGQTHLPGFSGGWEQRTLSQVADIRSGGTPSTSESRYWDGDVLWCTPTDITGLRDHKYLNSTARTITTEGLAACSAELIPARSVVMTSRATIGECAINTVPLCTNQGFKNFVPFESTDVDFLYYLLTTQKQSFVSLCGGSTFLEIGKAQLAAYAIRVPATKLEQTAIAAVLSDMDAEIAAQEQRREKTRSLKQAMMQELLTGKTRLVKPEAANA